MCDDSNERLWKEYSETPSTSLKYGFEKVVSFGG